jgi:nucleotide-binding universal stress UspA family protein
MKDLLAVIPPVSGNTAGGAATYALAIAGLVGAHLTALITEIEPASPAPPVEPDKMQDDTEGVALSADHLARTADILRSAAKLADVPFAILPEQPSPRLVREYLIAHAQVRDLVVLGVHEPLRYPRQGVVEAVLFGSGRPIILVPCGARPPGEATIMVAWDATRSAVRAVHDALPLLTRASKAIVATVVDDKAFRTPPSGADLCHYLARWGIDARCEVIKRGNQNVGAVLLNYAKKVGANLLVMGGFGHAREREFLFGSATREIFQSDLEIPVFLSH